MKRKYFLAILPALLALSSCSFGPKAKENILKEDTVLHEEIFGDVEEAVELRQLQPRRAAEDLVKPKIGVQYRSYGSYFAVRYVAEVATLNVTAVWTRGVCKQADGTVTKAMGNLETTTAYAHVNNGGDIQDPSSGYSAFVVYTIYDIPEAYKDYYMVAYLTITDDRTESVKSDAKVTQLYEAGNKFDIERNNAENKWAHSGHFLQGKIGGNNDQIVDHDTTIYDSTNNRASYSNLALNEGDKFGSFYFADNAFEFYWFSSFFGHSLGFFDAASMAGYASPKLGGQYRLGVSDGNADQIYTSANYFSSATPLWLKPGKWDKDGARFAIYMFKKVGDETVASAWSNLVADEKDGLYKIASYDSETYPQFIMCRMSGSIATNDWNNGSVWNQTNDLSVSNLVGTQCCVKIDNTDPWPAKESPEFDLYSNM